MIQFIRKTLGTKFSAGVMAVSVLATSFALFAAPRVQNNALAENCVSSPTSAAFNVYPLIYGSNPNQECKDYPLVQMKKVNGGVYAANATELANGITATAGDEIYATIYIHNGANPNSPASTVARNVRLNTNVTSHTGSTQTVTATVSADNASTISQSYKINVGANERVEVVPNSGEYFDWQANLVQSGLSIGNNTFNVGDQQACFDFARYYRFKIKVLAGTVTNPQGQLNITKDVRNLTQNGSFSSSTSAKQGETVEYKIVVNSTTSTPVNNVVINDSLNSQLQYVSGTFSTTAPNYTGSLSQGGLNVGTVNQSGIEIRYQMTVNATSGTLPNTATASGTGTNTVQDTANVTVSAVQNQNTTISILKQVKNVTNGTSYSSNTTAKRGDVVEYRITVTNTGSSVARAVVVNDSLSNTGIDPTGSVSVSPTINYSGSLMGSGLNIGDIATGASVTLIYQANVNRDSATVTNTAVAQGSNTNRVTSQAVVDINATSKGNLTIQKNVRQLNGSFQKSVTVNSGETVEYRIVVGVNSGNVQNVTLTDNLPNGINYIFGTLRVDNSLINDGVNQVFLGNMTNGQSKTVTFQARATANYNQSQTTLTNTAIARGDNVTDVQDTAMVYVNQNLGTPQLSISKNVRNTTKGSSLQKSVFADNNDRVQFEIIVSNPGSKDVTNVRLNDNWNGNLNFNNINVTGDLSATPYNGFSIYIGTLTPGSQKRVYLEGNVTGASTSGTFNLNNTATATGDSVPSVSDSAQVTSQIQQGQANITRSKRAFNDTKNVDATTVSASREDYITYTLITGNTGNSAATNYVVTDDLSGILPFADIVDNGGGSLNGNVITYPAITIPAGSTVTKSFKVRVKFHLAENVSFTMVNTYGNEVRVNITTPQPQPPIVTPKTGAETTALAFGGISTAVYGLWLKRKTILKAILN